MKQLDLGGYPLRPKSLFIGVRRYQIPSLIRIELMKVSNEEMSLPFLCEREWRNLVGNVTNIKSFADGCVVHFPQNLEKSVLKWPDAILWIPKSGECGILSY
jgi:hypothetical protein